MRKPALRLKRARKIDVNDEYTNCTQTRMMIALLKTMGRVN